MVVSKKIYLIYSTSFDAEGNEWETSEGIAFNLIEDAQKYISLQISPEHYGIEEVHFISRLADGE